MEKIPLNLDTQTEEVSEDISELALKEISEDPSRYSFDLIRAIKQRVLDSLQPVLTAVGLTTLSEIRGDIKLHGERIKDSNILSHEVGQFFRNLIPNGIREPENTDVVENGAHNQALSEESYYGDSFKAETLSLSRAEYKKSEQRLLNSKIHTRIRTPFNGEITEATDKDGRVLRQEVMNSHMQNGAQNLIYESVVNYYLSTDASYADLIIQNIEDGTTLDLNTLLPKGFRFVPSYLVQPVNKGNEERRSADLKKYDIKTSSEDAFAAAPIAELVRYGDLTKKGSMISLLHEIAHAWQSKYFNPRENGRPYFERLYKKIQDAFEWFSVYQEVFEEFRLEATENLKRTLVELGVEPYLVDGEPVYLSKVPINEEGVINIPNSAAKAVPLLRDYLKEGGTPLEEDQRKKYEDLLADAEKHAYYLPTKSKILQEALDSYTSEERDAWAHALRTLRFLRKKGFDIEPELKTIDDVKAHIDPCLGSYQDGIEIMMSVGNSGYRFSRVSKDKGNR